jgi:FAD/FMN-containing dehydrogenase
MDALPPSISPVPAPADWPAFKGPVYFRGDPSFGEHAYQYATSSQPAGEMAPYALIYPQDIDDVQLALRWANANKVGVAVRSGGHHYLGASSCGGTNIQLAMDAFHEFTPLVNPEHPLKSQLRIGAAMRLHDVNAAMAEFGWFVPHGECAHVAAGGHCQTGGYGMCARAFGLFSDHIDELEVVTATGEVRLLSPDAADPDDRDLFWATVGGSPGNFCVITRITFTPLHDTEHPNSRGLKIAFWNTTETLTNLLQLLTDAACDPAFDNEIDFTVTLLAGSQLVFESFFPGTDALMRERHPELYGTDRDKVGWPPALAVYVQWANLGGAGQAFDPTFFKKVRACGTPIFDFFDESLPTPLSKMQTEWGFPNAREFALPYQKRAWSTRMPTLATSGFSRWLAEHCEAMFGVAESIATGVHIIMQAQLYGPNSAFYRNSLANKTSLTFRDATALFGLDAFYEPDNPLNGGRPHQRAVEWLAEAMARSIGPDGLFSKEERRVMWAPFGSLDLDAQHAVYFDTEEKYERLRRIKARFDPNHVLTANPFAVGATTTCARFAPPENM